MKHVRVFVPSLMMWLGAVLWLTMAKEAPAQAAPAGAHERRGSLARAWVKLYRDTWGVPHIYANTMADAAYAMGYAQAEDRIEDIYQNVRTAVGTMAEAFGAQYAEQDYIMKLVKNAERCEQYWETAPEHIKELGGGFVRGVEAYVREHPERKPAFAMELSGWQCMAVARAMIIMWPLENLRNELSRKASAPGFGSNSFAIAPARSAEGCAIFLADPHLTWEGMAVFYEARVHAGGHDQCGYWLVGSPLPIVGHTGHVAWATTLGGPDTSDVYMVKLNPQNMLQYQYNGEWRNFDVETITVAMKGQTSLQKPALYSIHGPVMEDPDPAKGIAYCGATPYLEAVGWFEELYRLSTARSCEEFYQALAMNQLIEMNILFADTAGNIQYVRNGRTPIRPDGYNWSVPVPGDTDKTRWLGIHDIGDLVQIKNPPQGYYQNCNVSPEMMFRDSPMTPDKYKDYIYHVTWDYKTPRGVRLLELLDADTSVTKQEAMDYALDVYDILAKSWQHALQNALAAAGGTRLSDPEFAKAVQDILAWDGQFSRESVAAPIIRFWRLKCEKSIPPADISSGKGLSPAAQAKLLELLEEALAEMKARYGKASITWGDINLIGRGGKYFACPGAEFGNGGQLDRTETVMDVDGREESAGSGRYVGNAGSSSVLLSFLHPNGIQSYSLVNWGQSSDPSSPHYVDQAEKLYAERKFKPTWFKKEELMQHLESEETLVIK
jgi:acyl-homoserine lactone acylase PvdQ